MEESQKKQVNYCKRLNLQRIKTNKVRDLVHKNGRVHTPFQLQWHHQLHNFLLSKPTWHPGHQHLAKDRIASAHVQ